MVMEPDLRPQRSNSLSYRGSNSFSATSEVAPLSELFICLTSKLASPAVAAPASSSMKVPPSKSAQSPGRPRDPHSSSQISLSTSLSRRLRTNGSMKGGQASPMFPPGSRHSGAPGSGGKRKGSAFESSEPSSPKVTCIGQVRVKGKRHGRKKISKEGSGAVGDTSFRAQRPFCGGDEPSAVNGQCCVNRNVKWVHLPLTICEGLRALGADFNCLFPCRSGFCVNGKNDGNGNEDDRSSGGFCGAVFARWVVEDGVPRGKKIELVVGDEDGGGREVGVDTQEIEGRTYRKNGLEHIEFNDIQNLGGDGGGRVSICIPPKNALLLMRCRSDPDKVAALANKFFKAPPPQPEEDDEGENVDDVEEDVRVFNRTVDKEQLQRKEKSELPGEIKAMEDDGKSANFDVWEEHDKKEEVACFVDMNPMEKMEDSLNGSQMSNKNSREEVSQEDEELTEKDIQEDSDQSGSQRFQDANLLTETSVEQEAMDVNQNNEEKSSSFEVEEEPRKPNEVILEVKEEQLPEPINDKIIVAKASDKPALPDCLLLMMCEPKLSMEVSKETWVCSTDFIRWVPGGRPKQRQVKKCAGADELDKKKRSDSTTTAVEVDASAVSCSVVAPDQDNKDEANSNSINRFKKTSDGKPMKFVPPRSSCHYPSQQSSKGESIAMAIEKKLVGSKGFEPFVLTRCKSEPMRSAAAKLVPQDI